MTTTRPVVTSPTGAPTPRKMSVTEQTTVETVFAVAILIGIGVALAL